MRAFLTVIAAVISVGGPALAEPPKTRPSPPAQAEQRPAEIVLASADTRASYPNRAQPAPAPVKHRVARVTTCRCGDPQADPDSQEQ